MQKKMTACILAFLFAHLASASAIDIDVTAQVGPDPWLTYYDRFSTEHEECAPVSGFILVQPRYVRIMAFYDATQKDPMTLSTTLTDEIPEFKISNQSCRLDLAVSRTLDWDIHGSIASSKVSDNENRPSEDLPEMFAQVQYDDAAFGCTQFDMPFMLNSKNISFPQSDSFRSGYKVLSGDNGPPGNPHHLDMQTLTLSKAGCSIKIEISLYTKESDTWVRQSFK